jgi:aspartate aminotransferase-like enzyme
MEEKQTSPLLFKVASEKWEFERIHRLNYRTFVERIPQHKPNPGKKLIDKFHKENKYFICLCGKRLVGMICVRDKRPFSLDEKLENLNDYLPPAESICEIRLLATEKSYNTGRVLLNLMTRVAHYFVNREYDLAIISGTVSQLRLYRHIGFVPFGPLVGRDGAKFQPMYITREAVFRLISKSKSFSRSFYAADAADGHLNLLPGPVGIKREVKRVFQDTPVSHRSEHFIADFQQVKRLLCEMVMADNVEILLGTGTLANDVIAAQLSLKPERGLVLSNGEFGERLIDHVVRAGLPFLRLQAEYGNTFDKQNLEFLIDHEQDIRWIWAVHCESSTGVLNDIDMLKDISAARKIKLCIDCISSVGIVPINLSGVFLASAVSGKGLGSYPGLSMVFYNHKIKPDTRLPRYLDLGLYAACQGIPFTTSSNLVYALKTSLECFSPDHYRSIANLSAWLRARLQEKGFSILAPENHASPAIITIILPEHVNSNDVGRRMKQSGYILSYQSDYLLKKNWIQISLMGECSRDDIAPLIDLLDDYVFAETPRHR